MKRSVFDLFCVTKKRSYFFLNSKTNAAFTIVELLVVIVVIGILASITIVSYSGISSKANVASLQSDLTNASKQLKMYYTLYGSYPTIDSGTLCPTAPTVDNNYCLKTSPGETYTYQADNSANPQTFYITATKNSQSYTIMQSGVPSKGSNLDYGLLLNLDAGNSASYSGSGTTWTDLSGSNNNGTLINGVSYSGANGGALSFDGVDDYVSGINFNNVFTSQITQSYWVKKNALSGVKRFTDQPPFQCGFTDDAIFVHTISSSGSDNNIPIGSINMAAGGWHLVTITKDTGTNNKVKVYLDGVLKLTGNLVNAANGTMSLGSLTVSSSSQPFDGYISDVTIYNRVLSAGEIVQSFNALKGRYGF